MKKRNRLYHINETLEKFAIMNFKVNAGLYSNPRDLINTLPKYNEGLYYTELEIIKAIKTNGKLLIYNFIGDLELVEQVFTQEGIDYELYKENHILVRTYIKELRQQLYEQQDEKLKILQQKPDIQIA
jgi:hypothetical protein